MEIPIQRIALLLIVQFADEFRLIICDETIVVREMLRPEFRDILTWKVTVDSVEKSRIRPHLRLIRVIQKLTGLPLMMHDGSGVSPADYRAGIQCKLREIDYHSYMSRAGADAVKALPEKEGLTFFHGLAFAAQTAMAADAERTMRVLRVCKARPSAGRGWKSRRFCGIIFRFQRCIPPSEPVRKSSGLP